MQRWVAAALAALCVLGCAFALHRCSGADSEPQQTETAETVETVEMTQQPEANDKPEIRAVWISYLELSMRSETKRDGDAFRAKLRGMMQTLRDNGFNTVFLHVRPFADALYRSSLFPFSAYLTGTQGDDPGYDPLAIACEEASSCGIALHAWINPFRVCASEDTWDTASDDNPAVQMLSDSDSANDHCVVHTAGGVYFDPAADAVQALILQGVQEILEHYPVAGIHIDDYFYPSQDETIDETEFAAYRASGGTKPLADWRRDIISAWMRRMHDTVKAYGNEKIFSASPAVSAEANRDKLYADVALWCSEPGYCDWIIPQVYVGFEHETVPFIEAAAQWDRLCTCPDVTLLFGLAAYKCGAADALAGSGRDEWLRHADILSRQIVHCRTETNGNGFVFFSYSYLFGENMTNNSNQEQQLVISVL